MLKNHITHVMFSKFSETSHNSMFLFQLLGLITIIFIIFYDTIFFILYVCIINVSILEQKNIYDQRPEIFKAMMMDTH